MKKLLLFLLLAPLLQSCPALGLGPDQVDLVVLADQVEVYRNDLAILAPLADPKLQAKLIELDIAIVEVENALRAAGAGGPVHDVTSAAKAALSIAAVIVQDLPKADNLRFAIAAAQVVLNHIAAAQFKEAAAIGQ